MPSNSEEARKGLLLLLYLWILSKILKSCNDREMWNVVVVERGGGIGGGKFHPFIVQVGIHKSTMMNVPWWSFSDEASCESSIGGFIWKDTT